MTKIGICTGGGDCPGLNDAIRAVVLGLQGFAEVIGLRDGLTGLAQTMNARLDLPLSQMDELVGKGGTILGTNNTGNPFRDPQRRQEVLGDIVRGYQQLGLEALVVIGGDGTQSMAKHLVAANLNVIGIPKTIDNDLPGTDQTIGFSTAVDIAREAAGRLKTSAIAHRRVMMLEVMGRDAGHIALHTGLGAGADMILIPERPFTLKAIENFIEERRRHQRSDGLIIIAEGAQLKNSKVKVGKEPLSRYLVEELQRNVKLDSRATILGHIQRGGDPNTADRLLAQRFATHAASLIRSRQYGIVVGIMRDLDVKLPYEQIPTERRLVPKDDVHLKIANSLGVSFGDQ